jgi:hypothetical protein
MIQSRILRIFGIALVLSLLMLALPVVPAMAVNDLSLSPTQGPIGCTVTVTGDSFNSYKDTLTDNYFAEIYFAEDNKVINNVIGTHVKTYKWVGEAWIDENGDFTASIAVPTLLDDYTGTTYDDVVSNGTYYIYITVDKYTDAGDPVSINNIIRQKATFTVNNPVLDPLSPTSGPAGTTVTISGSSFPASTAITFKFDTTTTLPILSGSTQTTSGGMFISTIAIPPSAAAGAHTISVTVGTGTPVNATFTVTASAALDPLSPATGPAGTDVTVSGANFPANTALVFKFDTTTILTPKSGHTQTTSGGLFLSTITIPPSATAGAHTITVTAGTGTANANFTVTATAALEPLSPASGPADTDVIVSGTNLLASYPIILKLDTTTLTPKSGDTSTTIDGSFYSIITIPSGTVAGAYTLSVTVGTTVLSKTFTVTGTPTPTPTPTQTYINVVQNEFNVGSPIGIGGSGFTPGATVTIKYAGVTKATAEVNSDTTFSVIFEVPALQAGARQFTISDGINSTTANFVVETTAPTVPEEITPEDGTKTKIPITFDWKDATDASAPVTYDFQIATDQDFTADSIVLEKKALTESKFILTEAEGLDLAGEETPYYWRVKAVDGALNESSWTTAGDFFTSGPSPFPTWATIVIGVFGGLFLLILGFWIGRRTAFYY